MLHGQCAELRLEGLVEATVEGYLAERFPGGSVAAELTRVLSRRTDGYPLFMVQTVEAWLQQGWVADVNGQWLVMAVSKEVAVGVPESLRQMIELQLDACGPED